MCANRLINQLKEFRHSTEHCFAQGFFIFREQKSDEETVACFPNMVWNAFCFALGFFAVREEEAAETAARFCFSFLEEL